MQLGTQKATFVVDLLALGKTPELNEILGAVFKNKGIIKLGFSFSSDMAMVLKSYPTLDAFRLITPFVDVQRLFMEVLGSGSIALAKATE